MDILYLSLDLLGHTGGLFSVVQRDLDRNGETEVGSSMVFIYSYT